MTALQIPAGVAAITDEWLTAALRPTIGPGAKVASFDSTRIGEGVGFLGELARVKLNYEGDPSAGSPSSVIVKLATQVPEARGMASMLGLYEREIGFYNDIGARVGVRIPRSYHAVYDTTAGDFALIMEDVQARTGDQLASCTLDEARLAVRELGRLHARWWQSDDLTQYAWLPSEGDHPFYQLLKMGHLQALPQFNEQFASQLDPMVVRCCNGLGQKYDEYLNSLLDRPLTLAHSDYRLDNMMFGPPGTADEFVLLDWQLCQASLGTLDLQYFVSSNLKKDVIERHTDELLETYHESLRNGGVKEYTFAELKDDYAQSSLVLGFYIVTGVTSISADAYNERGNELVETLFGTLADSMVRYEAERFLPK